MFQMPMSEIIITLPPRMSARWYIFYLYILHYTPYGYSRVFFFAASFFFAKIKFIKKKIKYKLVTVGHAPGARRDFYF